jgi:hypothetical protein
MKNLTINFSIEDELFYRLKDYWPFFQRVHGPFLISELVNRIINAIENNEQAIEFNIGKDKNAENFQKELSEYSSEDLGELRLWRNDWKLNRK